MQSHAPRTRKSAQRAGSLRCSIQHSILIGQQTNPPPPPAFMRSHAACQRKSQISTVQVQIHPRKPFGKHPHQERHHQHARLPHNTTACKAKSAPGRMLCKGMHSSGRVQGHHRASGTAAHAAQASVHAICLRRRLRAPIHHASLTIHMLFASKAVADEGRASRHSRQNHPGKQTKPRQHVAMHQQGVPCYPHGQHCSSPDVRAYVATHDMRNCTA